MPRPGLALLLCREHGFEAADEPATDEPEQENARDIEQRVKQGKDCRRRWVDIPGLDGKPCQPDEARQDQEGKCTCRQIEDHMACCDALGVRRCIEHRQDTRDRRAEIGTYDHSRSRLETDQPARNRR